MLLGTLHFDWADRPMVEHNTTSLRGQSVVQERGFVRGIDRAKLTRVELLLRFCYAGHEHVWQLVSRELLLHLDCLKVVSIVNQIMLVDHLFSSWVVEDWLPLAVLVNRVSSEVMRVRHCWHSSSVTEAKSCWVTRRLWHSLVAISMRNWRISSTHVRSIFNFILLNPN